MKFQSGFCKISLKKVFVHFDQGDILANPKRFHISTDAFLVCFVYALFGISKACSKPVVDFIGSNHWLLFS